MKREMDLVRALLLFFENRESEAIIEAPREGITIEGWTRDEIGYHIDIMYEAGLLCGATSRSEEGRLIEVLPARLTWQGHEFLDASRNDTVWKKAKAACMQKLGSVSFEILSHFLKSQALSALGISP